MCHDSILLGAPVDVLAFALRFDDDEVSASSSNARTMAGERILIVEDDIGIRRATAMSLKHERYRVLEARDSDEARQRMVAETPDCVILDVVLPGELDEFAVCREIRRSNAAREHISAHQPIETNTLSGKVR